jgi:hypothetical protein
MAMIKSALELALEKTKDMKIDKAAIETREGETEGKRLAGEFMSPEGVDIGKAIAGLPEPRRAAARRGAVEVFLSHLQLPLSKASLDAFDSVAKGISAATGTDERKMVALIAQVKTFLERYLDDLADFDRAIRQQYAPKLKQKEQELSRRYGQQVRLDPMQDPEFATYYSQNLAKLKGQYQTALDRAKDDITGMVS